LALFTRLYSDAQSTKLKEERERERERERENPLCLQMFMTHSLCYKNIRPCLNF